MCGAFCAANLLWPLQSNCYLTVWCPGVQARVVVPLESMVSWYVQVAGRCLSQMGLTQFGVQLGKVPGRALPFGWGVHIPCHPCQAVSHSMALLNQS
jgi:hypothetical protein